MRQQAFFGWVVAIFFFFLRETPRSCASKDSTFLSAHIFFFSFHESPSPFPRHQNPLSSFSCWRQAKDTATPYQWCTPTTHIHAPNQQRTLNKLPTELRCRNFLISTDWECKLMPNVQKHVRNVYIFQLSFHFTCHRWWLGTSCLATSQAWKKITSSPLINREVRFPPPFFYEDILQTPSSFFPSSYFPKKECQKPFKGPP